MNYMRIKFYQIEIKNKMMSSQKILLFLHFSIIVSQRTA